MPLVIDTAASEYQDAITIWIPYLSDELVSRRPHIKRLLKKQDKPALGQWLQSDPLFQEYLKLTRRQDKVFQGLLAMFGGSG